MNLIVNPGRPGSPITGQQSNEDVARSAALGLWSCSKSRSNKIVCFNIHVSIFMLSWDFCHHWRLCWRLELCLCLASCWLLTMWMYSYLLWELCRNVLQRWDWTLRILICSHHNIIHTHTHNTANVSEVNSVRGHGGAFGERTQNWE